jgi:hypothetical protein
LDLDALSRAPHAKMAAEGRPCAGRVPAGMNFAVFVVFAVCSLWFKRID